MIYRSDNKPQLRRNRAGALVTTAPGFVLLRGVGVFGTNADLVLLTCEAKFVNLPHRFWSPFSVHPIIEPR